MTLEYDVQFPVQALVEGDLSPRPEDRLVTSEERAGRERPEELLQLVTVTGLAEGLADGGHLLGGERDWRTTLRREIQPYRRLHRDWRAVLWGGGAKGWEPPLVSPPTLQDRGVRRGVTVNIRVCGGELAVILHYSHRYNYLSCCIFLCGSLSPLPLLGFRIAFFEW